jgi:four helix bundle protein
MKIERFEEIDAWKNARILVNSIYKVCSIERFKKDYNLADQIRRAAISIMANISEGFARKGNKEFVQFLFISKSSAAELQSHLYIALDQGYIEKEQFDALYQDAEKIQRQLSNFIKYLQTTLKHR